MTDWSYNLLAADEQALLRSLSVFSGSASFSAVQVLSGEPDDVALLDRLTALADKSLLNVEAGNSPRFRLLETIRQYAAREAEKGRESGLAARHAAYMAERFAEAARGWATTPGRKWIAGYGPDAENLRSVLDWAFSPQGDVALGVRLVASTVPLWWELAETPLAEGQRWLKTAAERLAGDTPDEVRGWIRFGQSWRDFRFADQENAPAALEAVELFRSGQDLAGLGAALWRAGSALLTQKTLEVADSKLVEAEQVLRSIAPGKWLALALIRLGDLRFRQGRAAPALARYMEGLSLSRSTEFWVGLVSGGSNMAEVLFDLGEHERAVLQLQELRDQLPLTRRTPVTSALAAHLLMADDLDGMRQAAGEALMQGSAIGLTSAVASAVASTGLLAAEQGNLDEAARLAGFSGAVHPLLAARVGSQRAVADRLYERLKAGLDSEVLNRAVAEGARWNLSTAATRARRVLNNN
jgi:tetratricopeptide (TPR) repeat protein